MTSQSTPPQPAIFVWKLDDCDYVAALSQPQALVWYQDQTGVDASYDVELADLDEKVNIADEGEPPVLKTFRDVIAEMLSAGETFPAILGTDSSYA